MSMGRNGSSLAWMTTFSTLYDAINFYYMPLLYIMGKNIIKTQIIFIILLSLTVHNIHY
jgi:hypothetical protein